MQTTTTDRQTPARGIVVALYHGKVVARHSDSVVGGRQPSRAEAPPGPGSRVRAMEAESWRKLTES